MYGPVSRTKLISPRLFWRYLQIHLDGCLQGLRLSRSPREGLDPAFICRLHGNDFMTSDCANRQLEVLREDSLFVGGGAANLSARGAVEVDIDNYRRRKAGSAKPDGRPI
jgi:hypothetical protein